MCVVAGFELLEFIGHERFVIFAIEPLSELFLAQFVKLVLLFHLPGLTAQMQDMQRRADRYPLLFLLHAFLFADTFAFGVLILEPALVGLTCLLHLPPVLLVLLNGQTNESAASLSKRRPID